MSDELKKNALEYHRFPKPGKLEIKATKPLANQRDLALAYSPGVAAACEEIVADPLTAAHYTARGNLVAVISNGTAVLGLGAIGGLASKPVMEGKAVLFKEFADIDVFDIEIDERDPQRLIDIIAGLEPTFGGINLEDIKAPDCFIVEQALKERMGIPVFHDDQHGTAIVVSAAILNGLRVVGKDLSEIRLVTAGAGAAALACLDLLVSLGLPRENILVTDIAGVVHVGRTEEMDPYKAKYAADTPHRTLEQALDGADVFLGLSAAGVLKADWLPRMADRPLIMALANPVPEILPELAKAARPDAILATGRTDYPNQVNNVLCFPFLFRGALDCGATEINEPMKRACVEAIADLARQQPSDIVRQAYGGQELRFGENYLIPKPFDPRLMEHVAPAIAKAAAESGVATRPIADLQAYRQSLHHRVFRTGMTMKPVFDQARTALQRVAFAEGEDDRVLQAAQQAVEQGIARPLLIGRREVIEARIRALGLSVSPERDLSILDPHHNPRHETHVAAFLQRAKRRGYAPSEAREHLRNNSTALGAVLLRTGDTDALICGAVGRYNHHLEQIETVIGAATGIHRLAAMNGVVLHQGTLFIADTHVQVEPDAEAIAEITLLCAREVRRFGIEPRVALLSHSNFGTHQDAEASKMHQAVRLIRLAEPELEVDGEMRADLALLESVRDERFPGSLLNGSANLLIMPNQGAANIAFNLLKVLGNAGGGGTTIGPLLVGAARSAHILTPGTTVRGLLNMTALAAVRAQ
ncbi:NADP-dependent malic enzyme [Thiohalocapsa marina]|uniref:NADP-dependent malic enzyme n=1 Tax=Thiohalocapsa marina TaxID=424902 RepID=A0A5M8FM23_9GAMM|nr:NADP-dependent malic enzyme [Thiohalocapsa marina]KAA6184181.1 NADP-dependent malic enzyme [Thiohalocapsa marina]